MSVSRTTTAVEVRDAFRIYESDSGGVAALRGLELAVEQGEIVVVLGPSGSGKTTLLRVLAGAERLSAGSARVLGVDLGKTGRAAARALRSEALGQLDQHYARSLSADLTCRQTVALQPGLLGRDPAEAARVAESLLERVGLRERARDRPAALSGGELQRVAVCAALAHRPRLLLADEPAGELDADSARTVYALLADLVREQSGTAVIVSHDPAAAEIADRLVYVEDGRVVEEAQRSGSRTLVVANGWLRLPDALLSEIGAPRRLVASRRGRELVVIAADQNRPAAGVRPASGTRSTSARAVTARLDDVTKRYGERIVLDRLTARFAAGAFTVVTGPSGSGKTTLLHLLAGLERPTAGEIEVAATKLGPLSRDSLAEHRRRTVALVTQEPGLVPFLTAIENVRLGLQIRKQSVTRAADALAAVGLGSRPELPVARLSAGERQRVALARALAAEVPLLLVDEPSARLDRENAVLSASLLVEAAHRYGRAVVCATHDPVLIERADEVLELGAGARRARTSGPATRA